MQTNHWQKIGFSILACAVLLAFVHMASIPYEEEEYGKISFIAKLSKLPPNEIGDALAGVFGTFAFIAASLAIFLQGRELASQRRELELTREEYQYQRKATQEMAVSVAKQADIYSEEQAQRNQEQAGELVEEKIVRLRILAFRMFHTGRKCNLDAKHFFDYESDLKSSETEVVFGLCNFLSFVRSSPPDLLSKLNGDSNFEHLLKLFGELSSLCTDISELQYKLGPAKLQRLLNMEFDHLQKEIKKFESKLLNEDFFVSKVVGFKK